MTKLSMGDCFDCTDIEKAVRKDNKKGGRVVTVLDEDIFGNVS